MSTKGKYNTCSTKSFSVYVLIPKRTPGYKPALNSQLRMLFLHLNNIITFSYEIVFSLRNVQVTLIPCFLCIPTMSLYLITFLFNKLFISFCSTLLPYIIRACFFCWSLLIESSDRPPSGFAACKVSFQYCFS